MSKMIVPNLLEQAIKELSKIDSIEIPKKILEQGSKDHYHCICVKARDSADGFSKTYISKIKVVHQNQWRKMRKQVKDKVFKSEFAGIYSKVIILHNPTKPIKKATPKGLSPTVKGEIKKLNNEGKNSIDIATQLKADLGLVREYINKLTK